MDQEKKYWARLVCWKCGKVINDKYYKYHKPNIDSHGICDNCFPKVLKEVKKAAKKLRSKL